VSAIRAISLGKPAGVHTIVGQGLFVFDDVDGRGPTVRLQHCLGVAFGGGKLYIADTYNNKIKVCNPATGAVETLVGSRTSGDSDDPPRFYQPGGLSVLGHQLYVADTNNGKIRVVDLKTNAVRTLDLEGLAPPVEKRVPVFPNAFVTNLDEQKLKPSKEVVLDVTIPIPPDLKLNENGAMPYLVETPGNATAIAERARGGQRIDPPSATFIIKVPLTKAPKVGETLPLKLSVSAYVCDDKSSVCRIRSFVWNIPVAFADTKTDVLAIKPEATGDQAEDPPAKGARTPAK
jgi:DNA-binding beta-propeller fold protein YncE